MSLSKIDKEHANELLLAINSQNVNHNGLEVIKTNYMQYGKLKQLAKQMEKLQLEAQEIIEDSFTLYDIKKNLELSLQNFILNNNKNQTIEIIKRRFSNSLAIYSVITYVLGVGDRHLDNIMVTKNGVIFHIDYSFCIGHDPKPFFPPVIFFSSLS